MDADVIVPGSRGRGRPRHTKKASRPTKPCDGPRMNPSVDVGNPPRPFRHLRMAERCSPDPSSSRVPVHSALVQKSVTAITNSAGRLSIWMLGKSGAVGKWKPAKSWQVACNQSNEWFTNGLARGKVYRNRRVQILPGDMAKNAAKNAKRGARVALGPPKDLILRSSCEFIPERQHLGSRA